MIKFAVKRPAQRQADILAGLSLLDWETDVYHRNYGLKVEKNQIETQARLLLNPKVMFADNKSEDPKTFGRWRIDGKKFYTPNKNPLKLWGCLIINEHAGYVLIL